MLEFNVDECLTRLRFGRYVWWAEKKCGALVSFSILTLSPRVERRTGRRDCPIGVGPRKIEALRNLSVITGARSGFV